MKTYELKYKLDSKSWVEENSQFGSNVSSDVYKEAKTGLFFVVNYVGRLIISAKYGMQREKARVYSSQWVSVTTKFNNVVKRGS